MAAKDVKFPNDARERMLRGVEILANAVKVTLGPPPGSMPSSTAARVACRAPSTRSFRSCTSTSVAPPWPHVIQSKLPVKAFSRPLNFPANLLTNKDCMALVRE